MPTKNPFLSKTIWFNAVVGVLGFFPQVQEYVIANPVIFGVSGVVFAAVNVLLRLITKEKLSLTE